ncbi:uncharacterized protein MONOS_11339 [Monocercomonoides exilis]|uniref:uncharacterized protein n=1 Tax=Monocercomonoides exilis TaxID=2049356 RepID=UPI00355AB3CC|nr:hypothetical protein MONOS_11339 [Monocercomonoides exilis]|eukprot:MONOS_11339.1-p1 / transcript=MONOS_11339.1 / gene=MONOS_11339 / organism=Monocercomonoides_exilis_PA203 / gene_product=unspecified product / transcript_product=unspecified product / location=Mono_scaffold00564:2903-5872(+) / protein_length=990 / sequence_SO=supercontig / SO=protein_coding / is_pseudo=false
MIWVACMLCYLYNSNLIEGHKVQANNSNQEKEEAHKKENIISVFERIDQPRQDFTTTGQEKNEIVEEEDDCSAEKNERELEEVTNKNIIFEMEESSAACEKIAKKEMMRNEKNEVDVDGENGVDSEECGQKGKVPCKTIKKAVERCKPKSALTIYIAESCNRYDIEPIVIEGCEIKICVREGANKRITTALDENKVQKGDGLFNVKSKGRFHMYRTDICVDTKRESGRNQGLIAAEGEGSEVELNRLNINNIDSNNALNCVLIQCKLGGLNLQIVKISEFNSFCALIFAEASKFVRMDELSLEAISTRSKTQSVVTVTGECQSTYFIYCEFSNCQSTDHKLGGAVYLEIENEEHSYLFQDCCFSNCSCKDTNANIGKRNEQQNDESKGGAIYIRVADEATGKLKLSLKGMIISDCTADKGEYIFMSLPAGREQIDENEFSLEMEGIYGKADYVLLEVRRGEAAIIDLLADDKNRLPYCSGNVYVGGDKAGNEKSCGRKEEPCDMISTALNHNLRNNYLTVNIIKRVLVNEPLIDFQYITISSMSDAFSVPFTTTGQNRGTLRIGANLKAEDSIAVFGEEDTFIILEHFDIEYPDAIEGDALNLIHGSYGLYILDVVFRPWYTGLKGESVLGGEGKLLPYKLIKCNEMRGNMTQLTIYGRNRNITRKSQRESDEANERLSTTKGKFEKERTNRMNEEDKPLCSWDSGLIFLDFLSMTHVNDSKFIDISDGVFYSLASNLNLHNCSFVNNHPVDRDWEKYPSLRHNIRFNGSEGYGTNIHSLMPGSDGLDGKPFGMQANRKAHGTAAENMDSYFFSPILKNITMKRDETSNKNERQDKNENEKEIEAVVHGSYLFPCGLTLEASKKKKGEEMKWTNCPVSEYSNETEMKVRIPPSLLDVDDYTSVVCRLTYSSGVINGENKHSANVILVKQKKNETNESNSTKLTNAQLVVIIVSVSVFTVVAVAFVIVTVACVVRSKKRRQYKSIKDSKI